MKRKRSTRPHVAQQIAGSNSLAFLQRAGDGDERIIANQLNADGIAPSQVTRIYSELQPCSAPGGYCAAFLGKTFPQAEVTWSFEYGATAESRAAGVQALKDAVSKGGD